MVWNLQRMARHPWSLPKPACLHSPTMPLLGFPTTSTLRIPTSNLDALLAQRGSSDNIDSPTTGIDSGRSQTGIFNIASILATPVDYYDAGDVLGWGLRAA
ncbi:hypothetical protein WAI453_009955 [Rhynchosporium graminicola]